MSLFVSAPVYWGVCRKTNKQWNILHNSLKVPVMSLECLQFELLCVLCCGSKWCVCRVSSCGSPLTRERMNSADSVRLCLNSGGCVFFFPSSSIGSLCSAVSHTVGPRFQKSALFVNVDPSANLPRILVLIVKQYRHVPVKSFVSHAGLWRVVPRFFPKGHERKLISSGFAQCNDVDFAFPIPWFQEWATQDGYLNHVAIVLLCTQYFLTHSLSAF